MEADVIPRSEGTFVFLYAPLLYLYVCSYVRHIYSIVLLCQHTNPALRTPTQTTNHKPQTTNYTCSHMTTGLHSIAEFCVDARSQGMIVAIVNTSKEVSETMANFGITSDRYVYTCILYIRTLYLHVYIHLYNCRSNSIHIHT